MLEVAALGISLFSLFVLVYAIMKVSELGRAAAAMKTRLDVMSAPAETLTQVTSSLQNNIGSLGQSIAAMNQSITSITEHATKIEEIGKKYETTEELTKRIHSIMIGSYQKGRSGENYLKNIMAELTKMGLISYNVPIGSKVVEYCVVFSDGKRLPIDSKVVATSDVEALFDEATPEENKAALKKKITAGLRGKIDEVCQYIDPQTTMPCAVMAIPDSLVEVSSDIIPDAMKRNVLVVGYSAVPQLIVYFIHVHGFYAIREDVAQLRDRLAKIRQDASTLDDKFFSNGFDRPMKIITNSTQKLRQTITGINSILSLEEKTVEELPEKTDDQN